VPSDTLPSIALDNLSLGRVHLGLALTSPGPATPGEEAEADFAQAASTWTAPWKDCSRRHRGSSPRGLLARATLHRLRGNRAGATADSSRPRRSPAGWDAPHACDAHLEGARLRPPAGDAAAAGKHVAVARKLVAETGYKRREREVLGWSWPSPRPIGANLGRRKGREGFFILSPRDRGSRTRAVNQARIVLVLGARLPARSDRAPARSNRVPGTRRSRTRTRCLVQHAITARLYAVTPPGNARTVHLHAMPVRLHTMTVYRGAGVRAPVRKVRAPVTRSPRACTRGRVAAPLPLPVVPGGVPGDIAANLAPSGVQNP